MGLGKTLEMIALMVADSSSSTTNQTTLIVAPLGIMSNWSGQACIPLSGCWEQVVVDNP
jgi:SWI/SNF-related matrix-associated actin-dependent regulator of chromatin subfamily A3